MQKIIPPDAVLVPDQAELKFSGIIFDTYQWPQKLFDGSVTTFEMLKRPDTVGAICVVGDKLLVLDEEQPHTGARLSFPTGRPEKSDVSTLAAAKREVLEETGYEFQNWRLLSVVQPHSKIEWFIHVWLATHASGPQNKQLLDSGEKIIIKELSFDEVQELSMQKVGYLGEAREIFEAANDINGLLKLPEFAGEEIDR